MSNPGISMAVHFKVLSNLGKVSVRFQSCQNLVGWVSVHFSQTGNGAFPLPNSDSYSDYLNGPKIPFH